MLKLKLQYFGYLMRRVDSLEKTLMLEVTGVQTCALPICFGTVVLEKTLASPMDCKEIQPVHSNGDQSWVFIGRTDTKTETPEIGRAHV